MVIYAANVLILKFSGKIKTTLNKTSHSKVVVAKGMQSENLLISLKKNL